MTFELDGDCGENLANLRFTTLGAYGYGILVKGLDHGEVVSAILATVVVSRHSNTFQTEKTRRVVILDLGGERASGSLCQRSRVTSLAVTTAVTGTS